MTRKRGLGSRVGKKGVDDVGHAVQRDERALASAQAAPAAALIPIPPTPTVETQPTCSLQVTRLSNAVGAERTKSEGRSTAGAPCPHAVQSLLLVPPSSHGDVRLRRRRVSPRAVLARRFPCLTPVCSVSEGLDARACLLGHGPSHSSCTVGLARSLGP